MNLYSINSPLCTRRGGQRGETPFVNIKSIALPPLRHSTTQAIIWRNCETKDAHLSPVCGIGARMKHPLLSSVEISAPSIDRWLLQLPSFKNNCKLYAVVQLFVVELSVYKHIVIIYF